MLFTATVTRGTDVLDVSKVRKVLANSAVRGHGGWLSQSHSLGRNQTSQLFFLIGSETAFDSL